MPLPCFRIRFRPLSLLLLASALVLPALAGGGRNRVSGGELTVQPLRSPLAIDGNLEEWDDSQAKFLSLYQGSAGEGKGAFDELSARLALQYDDQALYLALWAHDPTPLAPPVAPAASLPPGDGLLLALPFGRGVLRCALWQGPDGRAHAVNLANGQELPGVAQGFRRHGPAAYTQEVRLPWAALGPCPEPGSPWRLAVDLCFGDLDPAAGYRAWARDMSTAIASGNRWGGNMCWGFMDGLKSLDMLNPVYDATLGAQVSLMPAGTAAPANPAVMHMGNEQTRTTRMVALPAGRIVVDGQFAPGEWAPASATLLASEPTLLPNRYATAVHWAYAPDGLYVGLRWFTGGPHLNINDPAALKRGYDGGDALQIRLATDRVSHIDTWFHDATGKAALTIGYGAKFDEGQEPDALAKGARMALANLPGGGYTQELFLPWSLICKAPRPPAAGDSFRAVLDVFYSGLEGNRIPFIINTRLAQPGGVVPLPLQAPRAGFYTVVVDDAKGQPVRRLLAHAKLRQGQLLADWDGLDDDGKPLPAGPYRFRGLSHTGVGLKYLMTCNNPGQPPWQTDGGEGEWGGDHCPPQAVAADDWGVYLGWPSAEDGNGIIGCDFAGRKRWGFFQTPLPSAAGGAALLASDGEFLYFANEVRRNPKKGENALAYFEDVITCLDRSTGQRRGFSLRRPCETLAAFDTTQVTVSWWWDLWQARNFSLDTYALHDDYYWSYHCAGGNLSGLAARAGKLYAAFRLSQEIAVYSAADMRELARWPLPKPAALAFAPDGTLYAVSDRSAGRVDLATGAFTPVVRSGLEAPVGLAVAADGSLYVSDWGKAQCVQVFAADGSFQRRIGTLGGRPWLGAYDSRGMLLPRGLALDRNGRLWVAEDDNFPRRVSVWDARSGAFVREFVGGTTYGGANGGTLFPQDSTLAVSHNVLFRLDYGQGTYTPLATLDRRTARDDAFDLQPRWAPELRFVTIAGRQLIVSEDASAMVIGELAGPDRQWRPLAALGGVFNRADNPQTLPDAKLLWRFPPAAAAFAGHAGENYLWMDANGDGLAQPEEFQWRKQSPALPFLGGRGWGQGGVDAQLNLTIGASRVGGPETANRAIRFPCLGFSDRGVPRYDLDQFTSFPLADERYFALTVDGQGNVLTSVSGEVRKPNFLPMLRSYSPAGTVNWSYPTDDDHRPMGNVTGEAFLGPVDAGPNVGELFGLTQWHGTYVPLLTTDGLFVARLLRDPAEGGEPGPDVYRGETIQTLNRLADGRLVLTHGKNAHHLLQVTGLDSVQRFQGEFALSPAQAALAATRLAEAKSRQAANAPIRIVRRKQPVAVDGKLDDWDWQAAAAIGPAAAAPRAEVALAADDKDLFVAFKVTKNRPFRNDGGELTQLFLSGDAVDLQFAVDPAADRRRSAPGLGDCRLLFSRPGGPDKSPVAILYRARVPNARQPVAFRSPASQVVFDEVAPVAGAKVSLVDTADGYVVEAAVPLKALLPDFLWPGRVFQGDAGIVVADSTGRRVARLYRFNKRTQVVNDIPTEAALTPANWGELEVDRQ